MLLTLNIVIKTENNEQLFGDSTPMLSAEAVVNDSKPELCELRDDASRERKWQHVLNPKEST